MYRLLSENILVAEEAMKCDALEICLDMLKVKNRNEVCSISVLFNARHGILKNDAYKHYEFLDEETGEILEMNCNATLDREMIKKSSYPPVIKNAFLKYESKESLYIS